MSEQSSQRNLEWAWTWLLKGQGHKNMMQDVQKISSFFFDWYNVRCFVIFEVTKHFAGLYKSYISEHNSTKLAYDVVHPVP